MRLALVAAALSGCSRPAPPFSHERKTAQPSVSEVATSYMNYHKITKGEIFVNPEFAMLCRGASPQEVASARSRHGPHANAGIIIYMNSLAAEAFGKGATPFPTGAVIVKRKTTHGYTDNDGKRVSVADNGVGGMVKRSSGYDSAHGDWEYFYFEDPANIESGRLSSCVQCHNSAKPSDYVFGTWRKPSG
jgi:hypothetical protein